MSMEKKKEFEIILSNLMVELSSLDEEIERLKGLLSAEERDVYHDMNEIIGEYVTENDRLKSEIADLKKEIEGLTKALAATSPLGQVEMQMIMVKTIDKQRDEIADLKKRLHLYAIVSIGTIDGKVDKYVCNECETAWTEIEWHEKTCPLYGFTAGNKEE